MGAANSVQRRAPASHIVSDQKAAGNEAKQCAETEKPAGRATISTYNAIPNARKSPGHARTECEQPPPTKPGATEIQQYARCLMRGKGAATDGSPICVVGLCGRICRGSRPTDFETLLGPAEDQSEQEAARLTWLVGPDGLETLIKKAARSNTTAEAETTAALPPVINMLMSVGYTVLDTYRGIVKNGNSYLLVVMPAADMNARLATWDGLLEVLRECYPDLAPHLSSVWPDLERDSTTLGFDELERRYISEDFPPLSGLHQESVSKHISRARLGELGAEGKLRTHHVRAWLFVAANVRKNFRGDGYTWLASGEKGNEEWIMRNRRIDEMDSVATVPLGQPTSDQVTKYVCEQFKAEQRLAEQRRPDEAKISAAIKLQAAFRDYTLRQQQKHSETAANQQSVLPQQQSSASCESETEWRPTPAEFTEALRRGDKLPRSKKLAGLCGRVCRGTRATHFLGLAELDGQRRVVFMLGSDGLEMVLRTLHMPLQLLLYLGYDVLFVYEEIMRGAVFELVVIAESSEAGVVPATWQRLPDVVAASFGKDGKRLSTLVEKHLPQMQKESFYDLQQAYTHPKTGVVMSMNEARRKPVESESSDEPPWRMTENRLLQLQNCRTADVRAFLYHAMNLNNLYSGDGYTYTQEGGRGFREYLAPNKQKEELGVEWSSCPIGMPTIDECMEEICRAYDKLIERKMLGY